MLIRKAVLDVIQHARRENREVLTQHEAMKVLTSGGISTVRGFLAASPKEAASIARNLGFPVVLKVVSSEIIHKTDAGCVKLNVRKDNMEKCFEEIIQNAKSVNPDSRIDGVLVQEMLQEGIEVIIGTSVDPTFGATIMFGMGGIFVEALKDVSFRIIPIDERDIEEMLEEIRGSPVLKGMRGTGPGSLRTLKQMLLRVSELVCGVEEISEMDLNPVMVSREQTKVADARIILT